MFLSTWWSESNTTERRCVHWFPRSSFLARSIHYLTIRTLYGNCPDCNKRLDVVNVATRREKESVAWLHRFISGSFISDHLEGNFTHQSGYQCSLRKTFTELWKAPQTITNRMHLLILFKLFIKINILRMTSLQYTRRNCNDYNIISIGRAHSCEK
jgi:hypothetical protein